MTKFNVKASEVKKTKSKKHVQEIKEFLAQNTQEYCRNTTLHGLKYITNPDLYLFERILFAISFVIVVCGAAFFVSKVYEKWDTTPIILSINPQSSYIIFEPFPAVTICNLNQAYKTKAKQFSIFSTEYAMVQMLCKRDVNGTIADTITDWNILRDFIIEISQPCENMLLACRFGAVKYNCSELFTPIVTDDGLCCTFNMVKPAFMYRNFTGYFGIKNKFVGVDWNPDDGYPSILPDNFYPFTAVGTGESLGLSITLDVEATSYYCSSSNSVGFKILLHNPMEVPSMREIGLLLSPGRETKIRIHAEKIVTDPKLRSLDKRYRSCIFGNEQELGVFKRYSQQNCEIECIARMTLNLCGCITHYMPPLYGNDTICSIYDASCVERVHLNSMGAGYKGLGCPNFCWPSCNDLSFLPQFTRTTLTHSGFQIMNEAIKNMSSSYVERNIAVVNVYYKEYSYRSKKQTEFVGITDFLSSIGGIMGLFFGFSFISLAEIIFFAILRPFRTLILYQRKQKLIQDNLPNSKPSENSQEWHNEGSISHTSIENNRWRSELLHNMDENDAKKLTPRIAWQPGMEYTP